MSDVLSGDGAQADSIQAAVDAWNAWSTGHEMATHEQGATGAEPLDLPAAPDVDSTVLGSVSG
jgi:hypothetical protein